MYTQKEQPISVQEMCDRYEKVAVASIFDVLDSDDFNLPNQCLTLDIKPLDRHMHLAGPAFPVKGQRELRVNPELDKGKFADQGMFRALFSNCVVIINAENEPNTGCFGSMMSRGCKNQGARGVVIDGGTRDAEDILRISDWKAFVRRSSPIESVKRWRANDFMCPIAMTGTLTSEVRINPYDWVVADWDAVIIIPQEVAYEVLLKTEEMEQQEENTRHDLDRGDPIWEVFNRYGRL